MITDLPVGFAAALAETSRKPVQLAHFDVGGVIHYLSDTPIQLGQGLSNEYLPYIESWNALNDTSSIDRAFEGGSLEIRSGTLTLINSPVSRAFIQELFTYGIENIKVSLYQWFLGLTIDDMVLIDIMVCQDPISLKESSMLLSIDLVSVLMQDNPYLWDQAVGQPRYSVVIGKAPGVPLIDLKTTRTTTLVEAMGDGSDDTPQTGEFIIANGVGFPSSGNLFIDSEIVSYSWISAAGVNITGRGQQGTVKRKHLVGALITIPGAAYDYAVCAGPVALIDNLIANGVPYLNPATLLPAQNPAIVRFYDRPPWLRVETTSGGTTQPPDEVLTDQFGAGIYTYAADTAPAPLGAANLNRESGVAELKYLHEGGDVYIEGNIERVVYPTLAVETNVYPSYTTKPTNWQSGIAYYNPRGMALGLDKELYPVKLVTNDSVGGKTEFHFVGDLTREGYVLRTAGINNVKLRVTYGGCRTRASDAYMKVTWKDGTGSSQVLEAENVLSYVESGPGVDEYATFHNTEVEYGITVDALEDFTNAGLELDYSNIRASKDDTWWSYVEGYLTVLSFEIEYALFNNVFEVVDPSHIVGVNFNRDLSALGGLTSVKVTARVEVINNNPVDPYILLQELYYRPYGTGTAELLHTFNAGGMRTFGPYDLNITSWSALETAQIMIRQFIGGLDLSRESVDVSMKTEWVKWEITYTPGVIPNPDEERIVYAEDVVCDVTSSLGENPTPAQVVQDIIENRSESGPYLDNDDFLARHNEYVTNAYYLNGIIDGDYKLHDGLRKVLYEGMARLLFNQGKIKLLTYITDSSETVDRAFVKSDMALRSMEINNQPVSIIKNSVEVNYLKNLLTDVYEQQIIQQDTTSIDKFKQQDQRIDLDLINTSTAADNVAYWRILKYGNPVSLYTFTVYMPTGYEMEKGDNISAPSFLDDSTITGVIISITRDFGQGKTKKINTYKITFASTASMQYSCEDDGYGRCGYGLLDYGHGTDIPDPP